ncbi:MAG: regulatory signaling modulator protein AmpE [Proteobacteria bacterium]|nr:regulatory signaling modulator protein AmpE [Pseudomonadota bacterium]
MSAALTAVILVLLAGHVLPSLVALRRFDWLLAWRRYIEGTATPESAMNGRLGLALTIGLPVLLIALLQLALRQSLWGVPAFVFATLIAFWCWGPRDLDLDVDAVVDASDGEARRAATAHLLNAEPPVDMDGHAYVEAVFKGALRRWFGPLLWFLLLGPTGVLAYRMIAQLGADVAHADAPPAQREDARWMLAVLDWPAAQLMTFALALAANFDAVFSAWREWHADGMRLDTGFLAAAARASVDIEVAQDDTDLPEAEVAASTPALLELRDAMSLVWRMLLLWLAVVAIFVIARWL